MFVVKRYRYEALIAEVPFIAREACGRKGGIAGQGCAVKPPDIGFAYSYRGVIIAIKASSSSGSKCVPLPSSIISFTFPHGMPFL